MANTYLLLAGFLADRPTTAEEGRGYLAWDEERVYVMRGGAWVLVSDLGALSRDVAELKGRPVP